MRPIPSRFPIHSNDLLKSHLGVESLHGNDWNEFSLPSVFIDISSRQLIYRFKEVFIEITWCIFDDITRLVPSQSNWSYHLLIYWNCSLLCFDLIIIVTRFRHVWIINFCEKCWEFGFRFLFLLLGGGGGGSWDFSGSMQDVPPFFASFVSKSNNDSMQTCQRVSQVNANAILRPLQMILVDEWTLLALDTFNPREN